MNTVDMINLLRSSAARGCDARKNGQLKQTNPYPTGSLQNQAWIKGWDDTDMFLRDYGLDNGKRN